MSDINANFPKRKTARELDLDISICQLLADLIEVRKTGRPPNPELRKKVAEARLEVERERYEKRGIPQSQWPPSLKKYFEDGNGEDNGRVHNS